MTEIEGHIPYALKAFPMLDSIMTGTDGHIPHEFQEGSEISEIEGTVNPTNIMERFCHRPSHKPSRK